MQQMAGAALTAAAHFECSRLEPLREDRPRPEMAWAALTATHFERSQGQPLREDQPCPEAPEEAAGAARPEDEEAEASGAQEPKPPKKLRGRSSKRKQLAFKVKMCRYFASRRGCRKGDDCEFAHGDDEVAARPQEAGGAGGAAGGCGEEEEDGPQSGRCDASESTTTCESPDGASQSPDVELSCFDYDADLDTEQELATYVVSYSDGVAKLCTKSAFPERKVEAPESEEQEEEDEEEEEAEEVEDDGLPDALARLMSPLLPNDFLDSGFPGEAPATRLPPGLEESCASIAKGKRRKPVKRRHVAYKVKMCRHFPTSRGCRKGAECGFAHGEQELLLSVGLPAEDGQGDDDGYQEPISLS